MQHQLCLGPARAALHVVALLGRTLLRAKLDSEQPLKSLAFTDVTCTHMHTSTHACTQLPHILEIILHNVKGCANPCSTHMCRHTCADTHVQTCQHKFPHAPTDFRRIWSENECRQEARVHVCTRRWKLSQKVYQQRSACIHTASTHLQELALLQLSTCCIVAPQRQHHTEAAAVQATGAAAAATRNSQQGGHCVILLQP
jgi:hypothetical protein